MNYFRSTKQFAGQKGGDESGKCDSFSGNQWKDAEMIFNPFRVTACCCMLAPNKNWGSLTFNPYWVVFQSWKMDEGKSEQEG
jgi:hypothetical protein